MLKRQIMKKVVNIYLLLSEFLVRQTEVGIHLRSITFHHGHGSTLLCGYRILLLIDYGVFNYLKRFVLFRTISHEYFQVGNAYLSTLSEINEISLFYFLKANDYY